MNPMQSLSVTKYALKAPRKAKSRKKRAIIENETQEAETSSDFSFAVTKVAVAQICRSVGFKCTQVYALETLTNVATKYLQAIAKSAAGFSNGSNRTQSNLFDLINAIHDLCCVEGFPTGSEMHKRRLLSSGALKEIMKFVNYSSEVPFAKPNPCKNYSQIPNPDPAINSGIGTSTKCVNKSNLRGLHIPRWLPDFPEESLYRNCDQVMGKRRKCGEKLWEQSLSMEDCDVKGCGDLLLSDGISRNDVEDVRKELAKERGRVKFKIGGEEEKFIGLGVNMMNGVCKGGKRVSWNHKKMNDCMVEKNEDESSAFKRKR